MGRNCPDGLVVKNPPSREISYVIPYMWTLKRNDTNELIYKTERDPELEQELMIAWGKR